MNSLTVFAVALAFAAAANAEEKESITERIGDLGKSLATSAKATRTRSAATYGSSVRVVLAKDSTIAAGAFRDYGEVPVDFGGAENVSISISAPGSNLTATTILVTWAAPDEYFVVTDFIKGSAFDIKEQGGRTVPVYGPALRIWVANDGTAPVTIRQLAVYAFLH
jgi:hypothetical protein